MKKSLAFIIVILLSLHANAQTNSNLIANFRKNNYRFNYDVGIPMGKLSNEFINQMSWRGVSFENRWGIKPKLSVGLLVGWQVFAQRLDNYTQELDNGNAAIHGNQFRTINTFPMQGTMHYTFTETSNALPWIGLGLGIAHSNQVVEVGFFEDKRTITSFAITPQAGIDFPLNRISSISLSTRYNYFLHSNQPFDYSFLVFSVGIKNRY
ncbi:MAG: hypothetical protein ACXIUQ_00850 [Cecembia sp.]